VSDVPKTRYTRSADGTSLAYQVTGSGPLDLVIGSGNAVPIDLLWDDPGFVRVSRRLGTFSRTVWFEHRGFGASEGAPRDGLVGEVFDADLAAVLDAAGCERVALVGWGVQGGRAIQFSIMHPERVSALVLISTFAHYVREDDYPFGVPRESLDRIVALVGELWGTGETVEVVAPSRSDERFRVWWGRSQRVGGGPDQIAGFIRAGFEQDFRPLLSSVLVPTLVLHREGDRYIRLGAGRWLAAHIPGAKFVVLPGEDHLFFVGDTDALVDEIQQFLTGARSEAEGEAAMAAVLFTDIVGSTEYQARVGPREWSRLTDHHDAMVRAALAGHRGQEVKTTGDGFLATFDATGRALRCAADIVAGAQDLDLRLRAGVHTGEVEVRGDDLGGLAVSIAKRVCDLAAPGQVLVTRTVTDHVVGSGFEFEDRGDYQLKGVPGTWRLHALKGR
jgi:class 3 adenylate cyclase/pimeloyl-ACP methyl ester carboxylesterase